MTRKAFAETIGKAPPYITQICDGSVWPGRDAVKSITKATGGAVTANDFVDLPTEDDKTIPTF